MKFVDRLLTIVITITLTSAAWIVFGATWLEGAEERQSGGSHVPASEEPGGVDNGGNSVDPSAIDAVATDTLTISGPTTTTSAGAGALIIPVAGIEAADLIDSFLDSRGANGGRVHEGIDIMAPSGTDVIAMAPGTIAKLHQSGPGGNSIYVRSPDRMQIHYYAHLEGYASGLAEGQQVRAGQLLGTVGSSGNADPAAPHLHFEIMQTIPDAQWWEPSNAVNPYPILREARTQG
jgi:murein DD-endopeptidase MepM/ murein hydrolase activator NlpD